MTPQAYPWRLDRGRAREGWSPNGSKEEISRMLLRGPAYRARSWARPSEKEAGAGGAVMMTLLLLLLLLSSRLRQQY